MHACMHACMYVCMYEIILSNQIHHAHAHEDTQWNKILKNNHNGFVSMSFFKFRCSLRWLGTIINPSICIL